MSEKKSTGNETWKNKGHFALPRKGNNAHYGEWRNCLQDQKNKLASEKKMLSRTSRRSQMKTGDQS